jgi:hypothetical protein
MTPTLAEFLAWQIRYWKEECILGLLGEIGFTLDLRNRFAGTGSSYLLFEKTSA